MACSERGCVYPVARDALCAQHWNMKFGQVHETQSNRVVTAADFERKEKEPVEMSNGKKETKWGFLFAALGDGRDIFTFDPADYGLERGGRTANQARGVLSQNKATTMHRWSLTVEGTKVTVRRVSERPRLECPVRESSKATSPAVKAPTPRVSNAVFLAQLEEMKARLIGECSIHEAALRQAQARVQAVESVIALL